MNTNQILKKVISKYYRTNKFGCEKFIKFLAVDIENCYPIDFTNMEYDNKKHKNNLFLYIDERFRID